MFTELSFARPRLWSRFSFVTLLFAIVCSSSVPLFAQPAPPPEKWDGFRFLMGEWIGEGTGKPGEATGGFTFATELDNTILVRKNFADYPATKDRPAFSHHDWMILYHEAGTIRADYFDNEQHVIHYTVTLSADSSSVVFLSDSSPPAPRFRLTNTRKGTDVLRITFEIAPPGQPESFRPYIEASARRKQ